jgi:RimJ/RimL family protein N-acetyltransferase
MRLRKEPKVWFKRDIMNKNEVIGHIQLVDYMIGKATPHIEYSIDEEYRNQGIMSTELPKYLKLCKKHDVYQLLAVTLEDNIPSQKVLEKSGFMYLSKIDDKMTYIIDIRLTRREVEKTIKMMKDYYG